MRLKSRDKKVLVTAIKPIFSIASQLTVICFSLHVKCVNINYTMYESRDTYISLELLVLMLHSPSPEKQCVKRTLEGEVLIILNVCTSKNFFSFPITVTYCSLSQVLSY